MITTAQVTVDDVTLDVVHEPSGLVPWRVFADGREIRGALAQLAIARVRGVPWWEWVA